jgi:hypothetical protein
MECVPLGGRRLEGSVVIRWNDGTTSKLTHSGSFTLDVGFNIKNIITEGTFVGNNIDIHVQDRSSKSFTQSLADAATHCVSTGVRKFEYPVALVINKA